MPVVGARIAESLRVGSVMVVATGGDARRHDRSHGDA